MDIKNDVDEFVFSYLPILTADSRKPEIDWLKGLAPKFSRIAHFGCDQGQQTLSLAWILNAQEVVGIDSDPSNIKTASEMKMNFFEDIKKLNNTIKSKASQQTGAHLSAFLIEFKTYFADLVGISYETMLQKYKKLTYPEFVLCDITNQGDLKCSKNPKLQENYFDLVFSDHVLEHIAFKNRNRDDELANAAIEEMVRITKPGGTIVSISPPVFKFEDVFESFSLQKIPVSKDINIFEEFNVDVYKKVS